MKVCRAGQIPEFVSIIASNAYVLKSKIRA